jgi:hypothetical protein
MTGPATSAEHEQSLRAIDAHFAGRASPHSEATMRAHLISCAACKERYARHVVWSRFLPAAPSARERIARGLGIELRRPWARLPLLAGLAVPVAVALALVLLPVKFVEDRAPTEFAGRYRARNAVVAPSQPAPSIWTYHFAADGSPQRVGANITRSDELAFAYANPAQKPFLMIFAVDEHRHIYWFHPAWPAGQPPPASIPARAGPGPHELPEAVRHDLDGGALTLFALFSDRAVAAAEIEALVRVAPTADALKGIQSGVLVIERALEVRP